MRIVLTIFALVLATPALAKHGHHHRPFHGVRYATSHHHRHSRSYASSGSSERPSDCYGIPWCGCFLRHLEGVADRTYDLAREWAHWGHATIAHVGAIVVWPHHVGKIVGGGPGHWVILSGNDGHRVRTRERSVSGAIAFRERT